MIHLAKIAAAAMLMLGLFAPAAQAQVTLGTQAQAVFDFAAEVYPSLFSQASAPALHQGYTYRYYASSGIFVGTKDGDIFVLGGPFGTSIKRIGTIAETQAKLQTAKNNLQNPQPNPGTGELYDLSVKGTVSGSVAGFPFSTPIDVKLLNVPAVNPGTMSEVEKSIKSSFNDVGSVSNLQVVVINNSSSRVTFDVNFTAQAVIQGISANYTYSLRYDYVKK